LFIQKTFIRDKFSGSALEKASSQRKASFLLELVTFWREDWDMNPDN
jgi:hypothetical protein